MFLYQDGVQMGGLHQIEHAEKGAVVGHVVAVAFPVIMAMRGASLAPGEFLADNHHPYFANLR